MENGLKFLAVFHLCDKVVPHFESVEQLCSQYYHPSSVFSFAIPLLLTSTLAPQCSSAMWLSFSYGSMRISWVTGTM